MVGLVEWSKNTFRSRYGGATRSDGARSASVMPSMDDTLTNETPPSTPANRRSSMYLFSTSKNETPRETPVGTQKPTPIIGPTLPPLRTQSTHIGRRTFNRLGRHRGEPTKMMETPREKSEKEIVLQQTMEVFEHMKKSKLLKALELPAIPHVKPITMTSLLGEEVVSTGPSKGPVIRKPLPDQFNFSFPFQQQQKSPSFDAREPLRNPNKHLIARLALKKRYQSKLTVDHPIPPGLSVRDYDFRWVSAEELDRKILEDIVWVRERYAQIGKEEPTDEQIIWWYDAHDFVDHPETVGWAL